MAVRRIHEQEQTRQEADQRTLRSLLSELVDEVTTLLRKEVALVKAETTQKASQAKGGAVALAVGAAMGLAGLIVLLQAAMYGLAEFMHIGWAALIVGLGVLLIAGVVAMIGMNRLKPENLAPKRSQESMREDAEFAKEKADGTRHR